MQSKSGALYLLVQLARFQKKGLHANAQMRTRDIKRYCAVKQEAEKLLEVAINKLGLSARTYCRVLKVACTIADLAGAKDIQPAHVSEAIRYQSLERECC